MKAILQALSKFQDACPPVVKSSNNPFFKSKFASLEEIQKHVKPHLKACGLVITQANVIVEGSTYVESRVWETTSGECISSLFPVVVAKPTAQDYGSAVSYAKRYSLTGILNLIVADEDDDANTVSVNNNAPTDLPKDKYDLMIKYIADGKIKEVESAIKKYTLTDVQSKEISTLINKAKSQAITKAAK
jgi:hypothetical protein